MNETLAVAIADQFVAECREFGGDDPAPAHVATVRDRWASRFAAGSPQMAVADHYVMYTDEEIDAMNERGDA